MTGHEYFLIPLTVMLLAGILSGLPVGFVLIGVPFSLAMVASAFGAFDLAFLSAFPSRVFGLVTNPILVAIPLFLLLGNLLERSDIARRMMLTAGALFGNRHGGMALAVILVGALLAASTGLIAATIFMMGLIAYPAMAKGGYDNRLSAGLICASGSLGQIIPPSILLILLSDQISSAYQAGRREAGDFAPDPVSVGDLFAGALLPGLILMMCYIVYVVILVRLRPAMAPPIRVSDIEGMGESLTFHSVMLALVAPLVLIVLVLGSILGGIATPTESAALGAAGALVMVAISRSTSRLLTFVYLMVGAAALVLIGLRLGGLVGPDSEPGGLGMIAAIAAFAVFAFGVAVAIVQEARSGSLMSTCSATATMVSSILLIIMGALMLSLVFRGFGGEHTVDQLLTSIPGGSGGALFAVMVLVFFLGFILEYVEIIFIVVPIAGVPLMAAGIDPVWFAILLSVNLQSSFMTPPFGYALFYFRSVAPASLTTRDLYISVVPFVAIQLSVLLLIAFVPEIVTWLPEKIYN
ncbi:MULTISPECIES: TRAP transporter large permease [Roseovarius]|uniref:TRAP transporter large permease n=1 Tax=Roseovarius TaxID=74030 RepID=UPI001C96FE22|nr:TRAP transporter large permease subunit [Roseovarius atlanticus]MBY5986576.1 TRAP transporter large permease subunit [Roseovarius atlanticus]MBY6125216.1 TRAP transporter large permease subunit [Roseovarius atlanticus]MBY6150323.1 TRAP transporter large permease subunit [Roseovarius atlanticus]